MAAGQYIQHGGSGAPCRTVMGVVEDMSRGQIDEPAHMQYYLPLVPSPDVR